MTVSRTINGHPYVAEETARKVRAAIRELQYRPNHAARILTGKLSRSIGLIVPDISDSFFSVVSHAVQEVARESGYLVWLAASNDDSGIEAAQVEVMAHHAVDGILLVPTDCRASYLAGMAEGATPVVTLDRSIEVATIDSVEVENRAGARTAVEHLIGHGRKRIGCVVTNSHLRTIKERIAGYRESLRDAGLPVTRELRLTSRSQARTAVADLLSSAEPDALFTANNASTIWVIESLREMGVRLGKDVAVVGFDDEDFYRLVTPPVTAIRQPAAELGRVAARLLMDKIKANAGSSTVRTVLPVSLIVRGSCGCRKGPQEAC